ncbi:hypothetical protein BDV95DRAFT_581428 [Massariosphaeria phaeospora]|uniref:Uncharacterized protein n=1 Tax=Massariosphaeria phaeospora TaxID=100035 RepID=A0A7C8M213_9PLEO|nr:hypothetical protein BDV95DRAFT_581428 [Massariosphaeria phaeospora]
MPCGTMQEAGNPSERTVASRAEMDRNTTEATAVSRRLAGLEQIRHADGPADRFSALSRHAAWRETAKDHGCSPKGGRLCAWIRRCGIREPS